MAYIFAPQLTVLCFTTRARVTPHHFLNLTRIVRQATTHQYRGVFMLKYPFYRWMRQIFHNYLVVVDRYFLLILYIYIYIKCILLNKPFFRSSYCKIHENPFTHFTVMLLTDRQRDRQNRWIDGETQYYLLCRGINGKHFFQGDSKVYSLDQWPTFLSLPDKFNLGNRWDFSEVLWNFAIVCMGLHNNWWIFSWLLVYSMLMTITG